MESVASFLASEHPTAFSFEILPPLRGRSIDSTYSDIERLMEFNPAYINITTHRTEIIYREVSEGVFQRTSERTRPGTVAIAAALILGRKMTTHRPVISRHNRPSGAPRRP